MSGISASLRAYTCEFGILVDIVRLRDRCFENTDLVLHATDHSANNVSSSKRDELMGSIWRKCRWEVWKYYEVATYGAE